MKRSSFAFLILILVIYSDFAVAEVTGTCECPTRCRDFVPRAHTAILRQESF